MMRYTNTTDKKFNVEKVVLGKKEMNDCYQEINVRKVRLLSINLNKASYEGGTWGRV